MQPGQIKKSHLAVACEEWKKLQEYIAGQKVIIDGNSLDLAAVVAASYHHVVPELTNEPSDVQRITASVDVLMDHLTKGYCVYGVNTGFGGSADSRTDKWVSLQAALLQLTQCGVLVSADREGADGHEGSSTSAGPHAMPGSWVRATMVVRSNHSARGHSAVTVPVIQSILNLLTHRITPVVPLRGTVSASGDLMPLAYIAGAIQGSPDIFVRRDDGGKSPAKVSTALEALEAVGASRTDFGPKEGLGLVNGTASSAALASLVMYETHQLAVLTQVLSAMAVEAVMGNSESFHPFIGAVRPHAGQIESARNIMALLQGSFLAKGVMSKKNRNEAGLVQDRYALRSAPQWIGPQLEDLLLAHEQVATELNATADNPLVDTETNDIYYGCNFQAAAITSAMEKSRLSLQMLGKLLFAQSTEMITPELNNGLPTNLVADDPNCSFTMKGVDISMAAYMAELGYLTNPVSSHVQSAEMQNQSVNSMAFVSARYTMQAVEVVSLMCASFIYIACQALDLRAINLSFLSRLPVIIPSTLEREFSSVLSNTELGNLAISVDKHMTSIWPTTSKLEASERCRILVDTSLATILQALVNRQSSKPFESVTALDNWKARAFSVLVEAYQSNLTGLVQHQHTEELLGIGSKLIYQTVRKDLRVPFHQGFIEHPTVDSTTLNKREKKTVGGWISVIYEALRNGQLQKPLMLWMSENMA
ncbi:phenylalanine ammonia-lyase [Penicillium cf. griseofulvum]|uniref:Phenylalanine ammonia-lyase n=1 Tax=Penicillium cf. griseofulvum TaxID=2972120 RepID=A0A9W9T6F9_9EURO|nr:phenylalanine ammonia-lyase [Penicillium cf. griseofulvum]KAJ5422637.1 phenylalanine ammonia-lyase [Penicillium cf. griseofulvum]KAJ5428814.1 phenylalanine ammonia-lyase [Penicillium cf. griseofulvum]